MRLIFQDGCPFFKSTIMKLLISFASVPFTRRVSRSSFAAQSGCWLALLLATAVPAALAGETNTPGLQFIEPTNNAVFSTRDEIPIVLHAYEPNDVFLTADVLANHQPVATSSYCCWLCPCFHPLTGEETILQYPIPRDDRMPPPATSRGWTNVQAGRYQLIARATGENGTVIESAPVNITVLDLTLRISVNGGAVTLVIPEGSLVTGGYDAEASEDLLTWTRLGSFQPGNVAAFYFDAPPENARGKRFYRSVYVPPRVP